MAEESHERDYVNDLPEGYPPDTPRCQHGFQEYPHQYREQDIDGHLCGLPVPDDDIGRREQLCYFHSPRPRKADSDLKPRLEEAVQRGDCLLEIRLCGAELVAAELSGADLWRGDLSGAWLWDADLSGASLGDADLSGGVLVSADLSGADLARADLSGAVLVYADLSGAVLEDADLSNADLRWAIIRPLQHIRPLKAEMNQETEGGRLEIEFEANQAVSGSPNLRRADFSGALLTEAMITPEADLSGATFGFVVRRRWWPWQKRGWIGLRGIRRWWRLRDMRWAEYHIRDERCVASDPEWRKIVKLHELADWEPRPKFAGAERVYRQLKLNYQESGDYQTAGEFFVREMECKRAQMVVDKKPVWQRLWPALMYFVCGYGERPGWIVACIMALILVFAGFHTWVGVADLKAGAEVNATPIGVVHSFWTALYFSVITFTSLGYADLAPTPGIGRALAGLEAVLGIVMMSLFLICIVRKFSR